MSRGVNRVTILGNIGQDPDSKQLPSGGMVCNFSVATSESWTDKQTGERKEKTEWHRVVTFRKLAEICAQYLHKGSKVYIEGSLQTRSWETDTGEKRYMTEIVARDMQMLDSKSRDDEETYNADPRQARVKKPPPANQPQGDHQQNPFDDTLPF